MHREKYGFAQRLEFGAKTHQFPLSDFEKLYFTEKKIHLYWLRDQELSSSSFVRNLGTVNSVQPRQADVRERRDCHLGMR